ncbi:hypothetical protein CDAR_310301 [Caerostris darwini]|uniref:Uncharacterized protein n=1 Tax=Caerostris darwini TaxID=1538125 RepID=A0AAV4UIJ8_9ARAC|nr:hypothetical protein CDAR_310301 [Caerostris darwini]
MSEIEIEGLLSDLALCVAIGESCERHGVKCPVYNVVESNENYEVREYPSLVWVSASGDGKSKSDVSRKLIKKIYNYLAGANDRAESLDMMVPVRTKKVVHEGYNTYTLAIGVSANQSSDSPPKPADSSITVARATHHLHSEVV